MFKKLFVAVIAFVVVLPFAGVATAQQEIDPAQFEPLVPYVLELAEFVLEEEWQPLLMILNPTPRAETVLRDILVDAPVMGTAAMGDVTRQEVSEVTSLFSADTLENVAPLYQRLFEAIR